MPHRVQTLRTSVKNTRPTAGTREPGELYVSFPDLQLGTINASKVATDLIGVRYFSAATNYVAGDFVVSGGELYQAKASIVAGSFNTGDWNKMATPADLALKENTITAGTTAQYWRGDKSWQLLNKAAVGLDQVDNTSDVNKPVSIAQATADGLKLSLTGGTMSGHIVLPTGPGTTNAVRKDYVDTADAAISVSVGLKADIASPTFTGDPRAPTPSTADNDTSIATTAYVQSQSYLKDAPNDAQAYGRKALAWVDITEEAPTDSIAYGRRNGAWVALLQTPLGLTAETRNRLVNPCFQIQQDATKAGGYVCDQWISASNIPGATSNWLDDNASPNSSLKTIGISTSTSRPSLSAGDLHGFLQPFEGQKITDFGWGKAIARQIILRFTLWTETAGTYSISLLIADNSQSYVDTFTVTPAQAAASAYTTHSFVIPGYTTGTVFSGSINRAITLHIMFAVGSSGLTATKGWQAGVKYGHSSMSNGAATSTAVFFLYDVGLYLDPLATGIAPPWVMPDEAEELQACMRYYQKHLNMTASGIATAASQTIFYDTVITPMRVAPAITFASASNSNTPGAANSSSQPTHIRLSMASSAAGVFYSQNDVILSARM